MNIRKLTITALAVAAFHAPASAQITFLQDGSEQTTAGPFGHGGTNCTVQGDYAFIGGGNSNTTYDAYCVIGGGLGNTAGTDNGGDESFYATVLGGHLNVAANAWTVTGGGYANQNTGSISVIAGGRENTISGTYSVVMGGYSNDVSGDYSVAAGRNNTASGDYSFVAGRDANDSGHNNSFVWGGATGARTSAGANTFNVWSAGGIYLNGSVVVHLSDRNQKEAFATVNPVDILDKVASMPMTTWRFKAEPAGKRHVGPMAQDFRAAFGYGPDDARHITATDADGVSLAAVKGLYVKLVEQQIETHSAAERLAAIDARLSALENQR